MAVSVFHGRKYQRRGNICKEAKYHFAQQSLKDSIAFYCMCRYCVPSLLVSRIP